MTKDLGIDDTLTERRTTHGDWPNQAALTARIKAMLRDHVNWGALDFGQQEALEMIAVKISRILSGNPDEPDHWRDIAGYARLVEKELTRV